jgi:hypothetical protein
VFAVHRQGAGIPLLGKSFNYPAARANSRIDFAFDKAAFYFSFLPFTIPYPVPFRLLGDERKVSMLQCGREGAGGRGGAGGEIVRS